MTLLACLPAELRGPATTFTPLAASFSGAGVHRVEAAGQTLVLKIAAEGEPVEAWRRRLHIQRLAADAGLAPRIVHVDEARRAVVSAFVVGPPVAALCADPRTREGALAQLARTMRRVHALPVPPDAEPKDPRAHLAELWSGLAPFALPAFVGDAVRRVLADPAPAPERAKVLSHNDVHPMNLVHDGESMLLVDWDAAGPNDPFHDLATISVFFRLDPPACARLLAAYDEAPIAPLPAGWAYSQRLVAAQCGAFFLQMSRDRGHAGASGSETLDTTPALLEIYQRMRSGSLDPATAEGQWWFGLALVKASVAP